ncbi:MAG: hydrogenase iron-sulfur subunit [Candidatus Methanospirareceae archaeon]
MFEPKIIGFLCNWCCYAGADLAGVSRFQYPTNIRIIRVMCSGRVDPVMILDAFLWGADGVFVGGCHPGDCHYIYGNYFAEEKVKIVRKLMEMVGIEPRRLRLEWVSASEGARFAEIMKEFTQSIKEMGPVGVEKERIEAARLVAADYRLRILATKGGELKEKGNRYGERFAEHEMERLVEGVMREDYEEKRIFLKLREPKSVKEVASELNLEPYVVFKHILDLKRYGWVKIHEIRNNTPVYVAKEGGEG